MSEHSQSILAWHVDYICLYIYIYQDAIKDVKGKCRSTILETMHVSRVVKKLVIWNDRASSDPNKSQLG